MSTKTDSKNARDQRDRGDARAGMTDLNDITEAALTTFREYTRANPEAVALWCLGIGFVLGWKLRIF